MEVLRKAFSQQLHPQVSKFVGCVDDDKHIVDADITGSIAHAKMLAHAEILTEEQSQKIVSGLEQLKVSFAAGEWQLKPEWEDVHMNVEKHLQDVVGQDALRLHTARSRNDQVALDMRIYVARETEEIVALLKRVQLSFIELAQAHIDLVMPGYTHLQRAQPILFSHALHAFVEMLQRDVARFIDAEKRVKTSPLGAGALSGTSLPIDPQWTARQLGFPGVFANSLDAVSDRDFLVEFVSCAATCAMHLSQVAETFILWSTSEFGFITLSDAVTTASSLMPNKKNPDPLEILRAKCGGITGDLVNLLMTLKGLPLGYNRDLQETKPPVLRTAATLKEALLVLTQIVASTLPAGDNMKAAASDPMSFATDLVEYLIRAGMPMRQAHELVSEIVADCRSQGSCLSNLSLAELKNYSALFQADTFCLLSATVSVALKQSPGGTAPEQVKTALQSARGRM